MKGRIFQQFSLGQGMEIREFWSRTGYNLPYKQLTVTGIKFLDASKSAIGREFLASSLECSEET